MIRDAGLAALQARKIDEAVPLLEEAFHLAPDDFSAAQYLSAAYQQAGRQLEAVNTQIAAVNLQPSNAQARYNLGVIMRSGGHLSEARQAFEQALQLQPNYPQATEALKVLDSSAPMPSARPSERLEQPSEINAAPERTAAEAAAPDGFHQFSSPEQPTIEVPPGAAEYQPLAAAGQSRSPDDHKASEHAPSSWSPEPTPGSAPSPVDYPGAPEQPTTEYAPLGDSYQPIPPRDPPHGNSPPARDHRQSPAEPPPAQTELLPLDYELPQPASPRAQSER